MLGAEVAQQHDILIVGFLSLIGVLATAMVTWSRLRFNRNSVHEMAGDLLGEMKALLDTGNDHTAGQSLARLESQVTENVGTLDRMGVTLAETQLALEQHIVDELLRTNVIREALEVQEALVRNALLRQQDKVARAVEVAATLVKDESPHPEQPKGR